MVVVTFRLKKKEMSLTGGLQCVVATNLCRGSKRPPAAAGNGVLSCELATADRGPEFILNKGGKGRICMSAK